MRTVLVGHNDYGFWFPWARTRSREPMELSARILLHQGVTTVKDCSGPLPGNARNLGLRSRVGSVALGKLADLVVIDGDSLSNILDMRRVAHAIKEGRVVRTP